MMQWCSSGSKLCCRVLVTALKRLLYKIDVVSLAAADWWPAFWNFVSNMFRCEIWTDGQDDSDWKQDVAHLNSALVLRNPPTPQRPNFMCLRSVKLALSRWGGSNFLWNYWTLLSTKLLLLLQHISYRTCTVVDISTRTGSKENRAFIIEAARFFSCWWLIPFFTSFFYFCECFLLGGGAQALTQRLIDESVCLAVCILATNPLTNSLAHSHLQDGWNMCLLI